MSSYDFHTGDQIVNSFIIIFLSPNARPDTTESRDLNKNPLTVFNLPQVNILDIRPTEANEKVDLFDKCMRNVLKGQFGHGKYHFTEYKFCKGWFGKKFSNEIELLTEQPEYGFEIDALNSKELLKLNEPEYENMSEDVENQVARIRAEGFRNYFERQKNHESE